MKANFIKTKGIFIAFLMSLFGIASCEDDGGDTPLMYGTPNADYKISGKVTNADGVGIKGIEVTTNELRELSSSSTEAATATTLDDGSYTLEINGSSSLTKFTVNFEDVDGEENGEYANTSKNVTLGSDDFKEGDGDWFIGKVEVTVDTSLTEK